MQQFPMKASDLAKLGRRNPRNFAGMSEDTVIAMAILAFHVPVTSKREAVELLRTLPIHEQHALNKSEAQYYARKAKSAPSAQMQLI